MSPLLPLPVIDLPTIDRLQAHLTAPLGTVVHLGADSDAVMDLYAALRPKRLVLIHGDPDIASALRLASVGRNWVEVIEQVVAPEPGAMTWHRCRPAALSSLLAPAALRTHYPRLEVLSSERVEATCLADVVDTLNLTFDPTCPNVLVVEAPGVDGPLISGCRSTCLRLFSWIALRGARQLLYTDGCPEVEAPRRLEALHYKLVYESRAGETLWPVSLLRLDATAAEIDQLRARLTELETALHDQKAHLAHAEQGNDELRLKLEEQQRATLALEVFHREEVARVWRAECEARDRRIGELQQALDAALAAQVSSERRNRLLEQELCVAERQLDFIKDFFGGESIK